MFNYGFISVQQNVSRLVLIDFYITGDIGSTTYPPAVLLGKIHCAHLVLTLKTRSSTSSTQII